MRIDHQAIQTWINANSRVLDLGCGDGALLGYLANTLHIHGYGIEINAENILRCVINKVNVIEQDLDDGLNNFDDQSFDTVIMSQTIQTMAKPDKMLLEMLRVGRQCIVTLPNFAHWKSRLQLMFKGCMPISDLLPFEWYNTPNIHFCTISDFDKLCHDMHINVVDKLVFSEKPNTVLAKINPNLFGETAVYRLTTEKT